MNAFEFKQGPQHQGGYFFTTAPPVIYAHFNRRISDAAELALAVEDLRLLALWIEAQAEFMEPPR